MSKRYGRNKGMRRTFAKRHAAEFINAGQGVDKRYIDQHKHNTRSLGRVVQPRDFFYSQDGTVILPRVLQHEEQVPPTRTHFTETGVRIGACTPERKAVVESLHAFWKQEQQTGHELLPKICVHEGKITKTKIWMYYSSGHRYVFVKETKFFFQCSITYTSRGRAMAALESQNISWIEYQEKAQDTAG